MYFSESDFYLRQQREDRRWAIASSLAVAVHAAVLLLVIYMPSLFDSQQIVEEVVSVSLVSMGEAGGPSEPAGAAPPPPPSKPAAEKKVEPPPPPPPPPKPEPAPEPTVPPESMAPTPKVPVAPPEETAPPEPEVAKDPVSIFPDKRKIKKAQDTRLEEEKVRERELVEKKQQELEKKLEEQELAKRMQEVQRKAEQKRLQEKAEEKKKLEERELAKKIEEQKQAAERREAIRREDERKKAAELARLEQARAEAAARAAAAEASRLAGEARAAQEALARTRDEAARQAAAMKNAATNTGVGRNLAKSTAANNYGQQAAAKIKNYWQLPDTKKWDINLSANVVITVNRSGEIVSIQFEKGSGDKDFDQLVEKTIRKAAPMPSFPPIMMENTTEIPCNFNVRELGKSL